MIYILPGKSSVILDSTVVGAAVSTIVVGGLVVVVVCSTSIANEVTGVALFVFSMMTVSSDPPMTTKHVSVPINMIFAVNLLNQCVMVCVLYIPVAFNQNPMLVCVKLQLLILRYFFTAVRMHFKFRYKNSLVVFMYFVTLLTQLTIPLC